MKKIIKISGNCMEGYLTEECPTCNCWKDGSNPREGIGCAYPGPIDHCEAFKKMYEADPRNKGI